MQRHRISDLITNEIEAYKAPIIISDTHTFDHYDTVQRINNYKNDNVPSILKPFLVSRKFVVERTRTNAYLQFGSGNSAVSNVVAERNQKNIDKLIANGYLEKVNDDLFVFIKDYVFNSPSAASDIILGNSTSGWKKWKTESGKTLEEVYKK